MTVTAYNCHSRQGISKFGTDNMNNSVFRIIETEQLDAIFFAIFAQSFNLVP